MRSSLKFVVGFLSIFHAFSFGEALASLMVDGGSAQVDGLNVESGYDPQFKQDIHGITRGTGVSTYGVQTPGIGMGAVYGVQNQFGGSDSIAPPGPSGMQMNGMNGLDFAVGPNAGMALPYNNMPGMGMSGMGGYGMGMNGMGMLGMGMNGMGMQGINMPGMGMNGMGMQGMNMPGMGMNGMGMQGMNMPGMGMNGMPGMMAPMQQQMYNMRAEQQRRYRAEMSSEVYRTVEGLTNGALVNETFEQLKQYEMHLRNLRSLPSDAWPDDVSTESLQMQLSRLSLAQNDPGKLRADPGAFTLPDTSLQDEMFKRLDQLLNKWKTSRGVESSRGAGGSRYVQRGRYSTASSYGARTYGPRGRNASLELLRGPTARQIESITADTRDLLSIKDELEAMGGQEAKLRRVKGALFNMLVAKGKLYDTMVDRVGKEGWKTIIDQHRGVTPTRTSGGYASSTRRSTTAHSHTHTREPQVGIDEIKELKYEMKGIADKLGQSEDQVYGEDMATYETMRHHIETLETVIDLMENPQKPNSFQGPPPIVGQIATLYSSYQTAPNFLETLRSPRKEKEVEEDIRILHVALQDPKEKLPPDLAYSEALELYQALKGISVLNDWDQLSSQLSDVKRGGFRSRGVGKRELRDEIAEMVQHLVDGALPVIWHGETKVSKSDAEGAVHELNKQNIIGDKKSSISQAKYKGRWNEARNALNKLQSALKGVMKDVDADTLLRKVSLRDLQDLRSNILTYYYNGDAEIVLTPEDEEGVVGKAAGKISEWFSRKKKADEKKAEEPDEEESPAEEEEELTPEEQAVEDFLKDNGKLATLMRAVDGALSDEFKPNSLTLSEVKSDIEGYAGKLQSALTYEAGGFVLGSRLKDYITKLTRLMEKARGVDAS